MSERGHTKPLHEIYASKSAEETTGVYNAWAGDYERDMLGVGYAHPALVVALLSRHVRPGGFEVLDAGVGTGIMGEILTALGFERLVGLDASEQMLARAAAKGQYTQLEHLELGRPLGFADDRFGAVVSAGVFTQGHAPLDGLDELVRVTRPGGHIVFSVARTYLEGPFQAKAEALESAGLWRFVDRSGPYNSTPLEDTLIARVFAYRVC